MRHLKTLFVLFIIAFSNPFMAKAQTRFVENKGQWPAHVIARAEIGTGAIFLEQNAITYEFWDKEKMSAIHNHSATDSAINFHVVKLKFLGANPRPFIQKSEPFETFYNYYIGNDPNKWGQGALAYTKIEYLNIYPLIDLLIESTETGFKYSYYVHPGGDYSQIKMQIEGADDVFIDQDRLKILTTLNNIEEEAPYTFQPGTINKEIESSFALNGDIVSFNIGEYNSRNLLVIDPSVVFSSLSLSLSDNWGFTATYDQAGNGYSGGTVYGANYPTTTGAFQKTFAGGPFGDALGRDCGIYKLSEDGTQLIYMTYYGGGANEQPHSLVVNSKNELIVYGSSSSNDLPMSKGVQTSTGGGHDIFLAKFNETGTKLIAATYLGDSGEDGLNGEYANAATSDFRNANELVYNYGDIYRGEVVVDSFDNVYVASTSSSLRFPVTSTAFQNRYAGGEQDAVVIKLSQGLDTIIWGTFLGGSSHDAAYSIDFDKDFNLYVTGGTKSSNFPVSSNTYDDSYNGGMCDAFVSLISADGKTLLASTFLGTNNYDQAFFIKVGPDNAPYVFGQTASSAFPTKNTKFNANLGVFITKFKKDLSDIQISKKIGAANIINISPSAFSVDKCGRVYFSGWGGLVANDNTTGNTQGLTTTVDAIKRTSDGRDFYMAVYTQDLATPIYATFWGGNDDALGASSEHVDGGTSRFDKRGVIYQAICAACNGSQSSPSSRFPTYPSNVYGPSSKHSNITNCNNAIVKIDLEGPAIYAEFSRTAISCQIPQTVDFTNYTQGSKEFTWIMGDGTTYTDSNVTHTYTQPGNYVVQLIAYNPIACNLRDTMKMRLTIYAKSEADFVADVDICTREVQFTHQGSFGKSFKWFFGDGNTSTDQNPTHNYPTGQFEVTLLTDENTNCADTFIYKLNLETPDVNFSYKLDTCTKTIETNNLSKGFVSHKWTFGDGDTSRIISPKHIYDTRGKYLISLVTNLNESCEDSVVQEVDITEVEAAFLFNIDTCSSTVKLTNNSIDATSYKWKLSDGQKFNTAEPVLELKKAGEIYKIELTASPFSACPDSTSAQFRMPGLPIADFSTESDTCVSALRFINKSTDAPNYLWDFGNGETSTARFPFVNFRDTGNFLVSLIAYPGSDCPDTFKMLVNVDTFRFAQFDVSLDTCNFLIQLKNTSQDLDSFVWNFGDGQAGNGKNPAHEFNENGDYLLEMFGLKTINGCRDTFTYLLQIPELPKAGFSSKTDSCISTYIFSDTSLFSKNAFWKASNGATGIGPEFRVEFARADTFTVQLIVRSEYDCWDTLSTTVTIDSMPNARFSFEIDSCNGALQMQDNSFGGFKWWWDLDENFETSEKNPFVTYKNEGTKRLLLILNKGTECEDSLELSAEITRYLTERIDISNVFTPNADGKNDTWKIRNLRLDCDEYVLYIYDRWGVLVREISGNSDFEWDGNNKNEPVLGSGVPLANGVYYYILTSSQIQRNGSITILR